VLVAGYASIDLVWTAESVPGPDRTAILTGPVEPEPRFGGCAPIVAMQLARQGQSAGLVSWLGDDAPGRAYRVELESAGVDTTFTVFAPGQASPRSLLIYDPNGGVTCCFHPSGSAAQTLDAGTAGQMEQVRALALTVGPARLTSALLERRPRGSIVAWDVKADPDAFPLSLRAQLLRQAQVITLNRGELAFVADGVPGVAADTDDEALLQRIRSVTSGVLAITSGGSGARVVWPDGDVQLPADAVTDVDPTGAGDVFFAGFVGAKLRRLDPIAAGRLATAAAASFLRDRKRERSL